jgi:hypothetical protein
MSPVHIQVDREVSLRPSLIFPQRLDAFSQLSQQNVGAGHALIVAILFAACVWHARQYERNALGRKSKKCLQQMAERTFDNRFRHGKCHFELAGTNPATVGMTGARFEKLTLDEEIGPEIVVMLTDPTPFADELKRREPFGLRLKSGAARTSVGPVLFLLWWIPPITTGRPFALYEQILNPTNTGVLQMLRELVKQTHLHLILVGPGQELMDVYEFESTFGRKS